MFEKAHGVTFESYSVPVFFVFFCGFFFNVSAFCSCFKVRGITHAEKRHGRRWTTNIWSNWEGLLMHVKWFTYISAYRIITSQSCVSVSASQPIVYFLLLPSAKKTGNSLFSYHNLEEALPVIAGVVLKCTSRLKENTAVFVNKAEIWHPVC